MGFLYEDAPVYRATPRRLVAEHTKSCEQISDRAVRQIKPTATGLHVRRMKTYVSRNDALTVYWLLCWNETVNGKVVLQASSDCGCIMVAEVALAKAVAKGAQLLENYP